MFGNPVRGCTLGKEGTDAPGSYREQGPSVIHLADQKKRKSYVSFLTNLSGKGSLVLLDTNGGLLLPVLRIQRAENHTAHRVVPPEEESVGSGRRGQGPGTGR